MNVLEMVKQCLLLNKFDALYNETGECGCSIDDLSPGNCMCEECEPAMRQKATAEQAAIADCAIGKDIFVRIKKEATNDAGE